MVCLERTGPGADRAQFCKPVEPQTAQGREVREPGFRPDAGAQSPCPDLCTPPPLRVQPARPSDAPAGPLPSSPGPLSWCPCPSSPRHQPSSCFRSTPTQSLSRHMASSRCLNKSVLSTSARNHSPRCTAFLWPRAFLGPARGSQMSPASGQRNWCSLTGSLGVVNWYLCPQVHTSNLMDDAVPASLKQGEWRSSCARAFPSLTLPGTECQPRLPLLHCGGRGEGGVGGGHLCTFSFPCCSQLLPASAP